MNTRTALVVSLLLMAAAGLYTAVVYPALPDLLPTHWNLRGEIDGWMPKAAAVALIFGLMALLALFIAGAPWLSPRNFDVAEFRATFNYLMVLCIGLFVFIHFVSLRAALHPAIDSGRLLVGGLMLFVGLAGNLLGKTRRNFWMGIRTPWTLASDRVWKATHRLAGRLMVAVGFLGAVAAWLGAPLPLLFWALMAALLYPAIYSLFL
jgi:immunity protein, SdpI family